jgi:hypothetical protein
MENEYEEREFFPEWEEDYEDPMEEWEDRCGYDPQYAGVCHHVGTEDCSFFCPFHHIHFKSEGES